MPREIDPELRARSAAGQRVTSCSAVELFDPVGAGLMITVVAGAEPVLRDGWWGRAVVVGPAPVRERRGGLLSR